MMIVVLLQQVARRVMSWTESSNARKKAPGQSTST